LFGGSIEAVVIGQYVLSLVAVLALYRAAFILWDSTISAVIACMLFLGFIDISIWNSYVLTESVYTSFICFSIYCLVTINKGKVSNRFIALSIFVVLFTIFIKPTGIALLVGVAAVFLTRIKSRPIRIAVVSITSVLFIILVNRMLTTFVLVENYLAGEVIYAATDLVVERPTDLTNPSSSYPLLRVILFVVQNPLYWTKLFVLKVYYLLSHTRPFWSVAHNIFSLLVLLPSYFLFFRNARRADRNVLIFATSFLLVHILSVGMTSDDWDGRFLIPMLPVIFIFSGRSQRTMEINPL
jgi:4-amino-4-deoxy-L-arabinose transferase-like glycosyltransferase